MRRLLFLAYTRVYSCVPAKPNSSLLPFKFIIVGKIATKFSSPKISSQSNFKFACSLSSMLMKITPSLLNTSLANNRRGYINASQPLWLFFVLKLNSIRSKSLSLRFAKPNTSASSLLNVSGYTNSSFAVL